MSDEVSFYILLEGRPLLAVFLYMITRLATGTLHKQNLKCRLRSWISTLHCIISAYLIVQISSRAPRQRIVARFEVVFNLIFITR
jgi:hypothetical protein